MPAPLRGFNAVLRKEFITILRDRVSLFFMFFPAILQIIAYGYALDTDVKHMPMAVLDEDRTPESRLLIEQFVNTDSFRIAEYAQSETELDSSIRAGRTRVGLHVPGDYAREVRAGRTAQVQVLIDGSNSTVALKALNTATGVTFYESLMSLLGRSQLPLPIDVRPQILYNPGMQSPNFYVPGMIGLALQLATLFATTLAIVRERESGTIEQLIVSRVSRWGLMLGKLIPYLVISLAMAAVLFLIMRWVFLIPIRGSLVALLVSTFLFVFTMLSLGLLLSTWAQNHMQAFQITLAFVLPSIFFSGFIFPREPMPWIFYGFGALLPSTYYIELIRGIVLRGAPLADLTGHLVILAGMGVFLFIACALRFRRSL